MRTEHMPGWELDAVCTKYRTQCTEGMITMRTMQSGALYEITERFACNWIADAFATLVADMAHEPRYIATIIPPSDGDVIV